MLYHMEQPLTNIFECREEPKLAHAVGQVSFYTFLVVIRIFFAALLGFSGMLLRLCWCVSGLLFSGWILGRGKGCVCKGYLSLVVILRLLIAPILSQLLSAWRYRDYLAFGLHVCFLDVSFTFSVIAHRWERPFAAALLFQGFLVGLLV